MTASLPGAGATTVSKTEEVSATRGGGPEGGGARPTGCMLTDKCCKEINRERGGVIEEGAFSLGVRAGLSRGLTPAEGEGASQKMRGRRKEENPDRRGSKYKALSYRGVWHVQTQSSPFVSSVMNLEERDGVGKFTPIPSLPLLTHPLLTYSPMPSYAHHHLPRRLAGILPTKRWFLSTAGWTDVSGSGPGLEGKG